MLNSGFDTGFSVFSRDGSPIYWAEDLFQALEMMNRRLGNYTVRCSDGELIGTSVLFWIPKDAR